MSNSPKRAAAKKKPPAAVETHDSIAEQTAAFLASGAKIEKVPRGVSGQPMGAVSRHIVLGKSRDKA